MKRGEALFNRGTLKKQINIIYFVIIFLIIFIPTNLGYAINIKSESAVLIESETGKILYEKNGDMQRAMASTSKLMTYLLVMDEIVQGKIKLDDNVIVGRNAVNAGGSNYKLKVNDVVTVRELLSSMMVISANDSAVALAEYIDGSVWSFSIRMNNKAKALGLKSAYFVNPNGMPLENKDQNKMSAKDLAILSKHIIDKYGDEIIQITSQKQFNGTYKPFTKKNTNALLESTTFIDGLKTGYTDLAGHCLVSTTKLLDKDGNRLISVVLGGKSGNERFDDSQRLLEYGLNNFSRQTVFEKGEVLGYGQIISDDYFPIEFIAKEAFSIFALNNLDLSINKQLVFEDYDFKEEILNLEDIRSILKLRDGTEIEVTLKASRGISIFLDDDPMFFEEANPTIKDNIILVPLRKVSEYLGATVEWDQLTKTIIVNKDDIELSLNIENTQFMINNQSINLSTHPVIIRGNTMVPIEFIEVFFGMELQWDNDNRALNLYSDIKNY